MIEKIKSEGLCFFCKKTYTKSGINRHLQKHLELEMIQRQPGLSYLLKIEPDTSWGKTPYFLSVWIDGEALLDDLDIFLRKIWLECCGHMSSFIDPKKRRMSMGFDFFEAQGLLEKGKTKEYEKLMEEANGEIPKSRKAKKVFNKGLKLIYDYDFGSTTSLEIVTISEFSVTASDNILLASRNNPFTIPCSSCGKTKATEICIQCSYEEDAMFCAKCAKKHEKTCSDFEDYAAMRIVNSPRMGVCGYDGGIIDKERDTIK